MANVDPFKCAFNCKVTAIDYKFNGMLEMILFDHSIATNAGVNMIFISATH